VIVVHDFGRRMNKKGKNEERFWKEIRKGIIYEEELLEATV